MTLGPGVPGTFDVVRDNVVAGGISIWLNQRPTAHGMDMDYQLISNRQRNRFKEHSTSYSLSAWRANRTCFGSFAAHGRNTRYEDIDWGMPRDLTDPRTFALADTADTSAGY